MGIDDVVGVMPVLESHRFEVVGLERYMATVWRASRARPTPRDRRPRGVPHDTARVSGRERTPFERDWGATRGLITPAVHPRRRWRRSPRP